ncbi:uncharacterized protein LOC110018664 isoform X3 [Phalaenopsis equestris]|uniref:uncharacterized protein LOC110018664 isoform X3 n=1 Tax=Phalaenopsis equestris TaxID=78828 RepID=UPI0009E45661|nr:uncharacterized protein LOC110018664 isoform X3 [Phalaenopsis equestris]
MPSLRYLSNPGETPRILFGGFSLSWSEAIRRPSSLHLTISCNFSRGIEDWKVALSCRTFHGKFVSRIMLKWTGGSRRKVATSRKSTYSRQKQYFEQRKRQRQASGQENCANRSDRKVLRNAESQSLDILNLINLAVTSQPASTELPASVDCHAVNISDVSLLGKFTSSYSTVVETRLEEVTNSSNRLISFCLFFVTKRCAGQVNKCKMAGSIPEHTSSWKEDTFIEKKENPQIEATVLDILGDDEPYSNGRLIPESHVALSVDGLGKIGSQTPTHSPRMQNRFSCKGFYMASKAPRKVRSTSPQVSADNDCNEELNDMIDDFGVSPLCNKSAKLAYNDAKITHKSRVALASPYSHEDQGEEKSIKGKGLDACLLVSNEKHSIDSFGYLGKQFIEDSYDAASHNNRFSFVGYPFLNPTTKKFEKIEQSDIGVRDTFFGSSRNLWEGDEIFEASATSTPYFMHSTPEKEGSPSFIWESADGMLKPPTWSFLSTEDSQDNLNILSEDLSSSATVRKKNNLNFDTHPMGLGENKRNPSDKFQWNSVGMFSQGENIFTGLDDAIWGKKQNSSSAFERTDDDNIFISNPFSSYRMRSTSTSGYEAMFQDEHFDPFPTSKFNFKIPSERDATNDFIDQNEMFRKNTSFEFDLHMPMKPTTKAKCLGRFSSSGGDFFKDRLPKYQEYNEDRGSSGKPQPKDYEKRSTSSGNAESAAEAEILSKVTENEESKNKCPHPSDSQRIENSVEQTEAIPTVMEELPTQIQNYVHSKLNQFQGNSPVPSHPSNEESKSTFDPEIKKEQSECGGNGDASYQVMLQSYVLQLLCVQKVLLEASGKDIKKERPCRWI